MWDTYKWQLQFLCRIGVLDNKLTERLSDAMSSSIFRNLVILVVRNIELVLGSITHTKTFPRTSMFDSYK